MRTLFWTAWEVTNNLAVSYRRETTHRCALSFTRSLRNNTTTAWLLTTQYSTLISSFITVFIITWPYLGSQQQLWHKSKLALKQSTVLESFITVYRSETEMEISICGAPWEGCAGSQSQEESTCCNVPTSLFLGATLSCRGHNWPLFSPWDYTRGS